jgi:hypothetical protein
MSALLDAALGYAARGIPVYPIHWPRPTPDGISLACSCPRGRYCDRPAKHPLVWHGVKDASRDPAQLQRWWQRWPDANIGLATGIVFDALDIDGLAGMAALRDHLSALDRRHPGPLVATGAVAGTTGTPPAGSVTAHPEASATWTGGAWGAACWPHPAATQAAAATAGSATWTRRTCPRSPRPYGRCCNPPDRRPAPAPRAGFGRRRWATPMRGRCWPPSWPSSGRPGPAAATAP